MNCERSDNTCQAITSLSLLPHYLAKFAHSTVQK